MSTQASPRRPGIKSPAARSCGPGLKVLYALGPAARPAPEAALPPGALAAARPALRPGPGNSSRTGRRRWRPGSLSARRWLGRLWVARRRLPRRGPACSRGTGSAGGSCSGFTRARPRGPCPQAADPPGSPNRPGSGPAGLGPLLAPEDVRSRRKPNPAPNERPISPCYPVSSRSWASGGLRRRRGLNWGDPESKRQTVHP